MSIRHGLMIVGRSSKPTKGTGTRQTNEAAAPEAVAASACSKTSTALVAQSEAPRWSPVRASRSNASFLLQLIATAEQIPQTRILRRAAVADAMLYYNTAMKPAAESGATSERLSRII